MAQIVVGIAASHTPQLSSGADLWADHGRRDSTMPRLLGRDGEYHSFDELAAAADPGIQAELTPEVWRAKYQRTQDGIAELTRRLAEARPDVAVIIGDDQWELFRDEGVPAFALYLGDELWDEPRSEQELAKLAEGLRAAQWAQHADRRMTHPIDAKLSEHITEALCVAEFDIHRFSVQGENRSLGHAFTFPRYRLGLPAETPIVPIFINTYYPPNVPTPGRCLRLGRVLAEAIRDWPQDVRVAVITSGGLSHFVIDEELDRQVLDAIGGGDLTSLESIERKRLRSGNSEILNWITAAGALTGLRAEIVDYVPGYRSVAGTGTGMAFAAWS